MQTFEYLKALYIFLLFVLLGIATSVSLAFPDTTRYAYAAAILVHSIAMLIIFIQDIRTPQTPQDKESDT